MTDDRFGPRSANQHDSIVELLDAYSAGELDPDQYSLVQYHLKQCQSCQLFLRDIQQMHGFLLWKTNDQMNATQLIASSIDEQKFQEEYKGRLLGNQFEQIPLSFSARKRRVVAGAFTRLVAIVAACLLISSVLIAFNTLYSQSAHPVRPATPIIKQQTVPAPISSSPAMSQVPLTQKNIFWSLHMFNVDNGWATNKSGILRTTDGGSHWHIVSPPGPYDFGLSTSNFFSSSVAWLIAMNNDTSQYTSFRTTDGGQTWQRGDSLGNVMIMQNRYVRVGTLSVISPEECWLYVAALGITQPSFLHTLDGGNHWTVQPIKLPDSSIIESGSFHDGTTGWVVSNSSTITTIHSLYVTHNGGQTWQKQPLALPSDIASATLKLPTFLSDRFGMLPLTFMRNSESNITYALVYRTDDGGTTWVQSSIITLLATSDARSPSVEFSFNAPDYWISSEIKRYPTQDGTYQDQLLLHTTNNAGQNWTLTRSTTLLQAVNNCEMFTTTLGLALGVPGKATIAVSPLPEGTPGRDGGILLKTTDGGQNWQAVNYSIS